MARSSGRTRSAIAQALALEEILGVIGSHLGTCTTLCGLDTQTNRAAAAAKARFLAHYLYVLPLEVGRVEGEPIELATSPLAGARLHLGTNKWEPTRAAVGAPAAAAAFLPVVSAVGAPNGPQRLCFYAQRSLKNKPGEELSPVADGHAEYSPTDDAWAFFPGPPDGPARRLAVSCALGDDLYVLGGLEGQLFDPSPAVRRLRGSTWTSVAPLTVARFAPCVLAVNESLVVLGGLTESPAGVYGDLTRSRLTEVYDASTNTWAAGPDLLFDAHEGEVVTAALGGDVYAIRAHYKDGEAAQLQVWRRGGARFEPRAPLPLPPGEACGPDDVFATNALLATGGRLVAFSGKIDDHQAAYSSPVVIQAFDPAANAWAPLLRVANPALGFAAIVHGDRALCPLRGPRTAAGEETTRIGVLDLRAPLARRWTVGPATKLLDPRHGPLFCVARGRE